MKIICVGGAPSSGSTLLADLLDSAPGVVCPPELYIFADPGAYAFDAEFKARALARVPVQSRSPYARPRPFYDDKHLSKTGIDAEQLRKMIESADTLPAFVSALADRQAEFRERDVEVFCEKTPINANEAVNFCQLFPDGLFVHIVRDPEASLASIQRRGFGLYEATLIWAYQNWAGLRAAGLPNYRRVRYEDLVAAPFDTVAKLLEAADVAVDPAEIEKQFQSNAYRQSIAVPAKWSSGGDRSRIHSSKARRLDEGDRNIAGSLTMEVLDKDGQTPELNLISIAEICAQLGVTPLSQPGAIVTDEMRASFDAYCESYWAETKTAANQQNIRMVLEPPPIPQPAIIRRQDGIEQQTQLRVLQGPTGQANQPETLARALRGLGHYAHSCSVANHPFGYAVTYPIGVPPGPNVSNAIANLTYLADRYDIFHFHTRSFLTRFGDGLPYPGLLDMLWLKSLGKKVFFHFRGSEIRNKVIFDRLNPYHFRPDEVDALAVFTIPQKMKTELAQFVDAVCDGVFVTDEEIRQYVGQNSIIVPRAVDPTALGFTEPVDRAVPVIVHAPSRRGAKGTEHVIAAVERLRARGIKCELRLIEGMSHAEAVEEYRAADIILDQLRLGWYGVFSVEGMALGKPVICYIRPDLWQDQNGALPLANANPDTVEDVLEELLLDPIKRRELGKRAHDFFLRTHSADKVALKLEKLYQLCDRSIESVDWVRATRILDRQVDEVDAVRSAKLTKQVERMRGAYATRMRETKDRHKEEIAALRRDMRWSPLRYTRAIRRRLSFTLNRPK